MESREPSKGRANPPQGERQELVLEDGMSKAMSVGNDRTLSLEEKMLLEKEPCPLQVGTGVVIALSWESGIRSWQQTRLTGSPTPQNRPYCLERACSGFHN